MTLERLLQKKQETRLNIKMNNAITSPLSDCRIQLDEDGELIIPKDLTKAEFYEAYRRSRRYKSWVKAWVRRLEQYGIETYGLEEMKAIYTQVNMELGDEQTLPQGISLNPPDKSSGIITIEGVVQQFGLWERRMKREIPNWGVENIKKALEVLHPIEQKAQELRELLKQKEGNANG